MSVGRVLGVENGLKWKKFRLCRRVEVRDKQWSGGRRRHGCWNKKRWINQSINAVNQTVNRWKALTIKQSVNQAINRPIVCRNRSMLLANRSPHVNFAYFQNNSKTKTWTIVHVLTRFSSGRVRPAWRPKTMEVHCINTGQSSNQVLESRINYTEVFLSFRSGIRFLIIPLKKFSFLKSSFHYLSRWNSF